MSLSPSPSSAEPKKRQDAGEGVQILILDDDAELTELLRNLFAEQGWQALAAVRIADARRILSEQRVDLALIDGVLPDGSGFQFVDELATAGSSTPCVFMSSFYKDMKTRRDLLAYSCVRAVWQKPLRINEVACQIEGLLDAPPRATERQENRSRPEPAVQEALAELRQSYSTKLASQLSSLQQQLESASNDATGETTRAALRSAHKIRGTAGTFGFPVVGELIGTVEETLRGVEEGAKTITPELLQGCSSQVLLAQDRLGHHGAGSGALPLPADGAAQLEVGATILLVDDDADFLAAMQRAGREKLFRVLTAQSPEEALAQARSSNIQGAFIDIHLGASAGGFDVARQLRSLPRLETLPLAIVTSRGSVDSRVAALNAGASLFLEKPIDAAQFAAAAEQLVELRTVSQPRVLIVDDDADLGRYVCAILAEEGMEARHSQRATEALDLLAEFRPDLVLIDLMMPDISGFDLCRILRMTPEWSNLPVLLMTARLGQDVRVATFEAGAEDYIPKPISKPELLARIRLRFERKMFCDERAHYDPTTRLMTRRAFTDSVNLRLAEARRHSGCLSLALIDLDHFKRVNDEHGHLAGDQVLGVLGKLLRYRLRTEDLRCRWGGEEFAIALPNVEPEVAGQLLERLHEELAAFDFRDDQGRLFHCTFSAGVASVPNDGDVLGELVRVADKRLYAAKEAGRARVHTK